MKTNKFNEAVVHVTDYLKTKTLNKDECFNVTIKPGPQTITIKFNSIRYPRIFKLLFNKDMNSFTMYLGQCNDNAVWSTEALEMDKWMNQVRLVIATQAFAHSMPLSISKLGVFNKIYLNFINEALSGKNKPGKWEKDGIYSEYTSFWGKNNNGITIYEKPVEYDYSEREGMSLFSSENDTMLLNEVILKRKAYNQACLVEQEARRIRMEKLDVDPWSVVPSKP